MAGPLRCVTRDGVSNSGRAWHRLPEKHISSRPSSSDVREGTLTSSQTGSQTEVRYPATACGERCDQGTGRIAGKFVGQRRTAAGWRRRGQLHSSALQSSESAPATSGATSAPQTAFGVAFHPGASLSSVVQPACMPCALRTPPSAAPLGQSHASQ